MSGDQYKAMAKDIILNFGPWSFNDADQTLTRSAEASLFPDVEGTEFKDKVSLTGDELRLTRANGTQIYRRAR
jgi:hypothetical protein